MDNDPFVNEFPFAQKDKVRNCLKCKHCKLTIYITDDDFWTSVGCDKECPDCLNFDCLQCLMCDHFEECLRNENIGQDRVAV